MRYCIFGKALYDRRPRPLAGPFKKLQSARHAIRVLRWEGYRDVRIRRWRSPSQSRVRRPAARIQD